MASKTVKVDIASVLLQEAAKVGDFVLQYQTMNDIWTFRYIDLMQEDEFFIAPAAQDVLVSAIAHGNNPDWLDEKVPTQQSAQQSVQLTGGTLPDFQALSQPEDLSGLEADTTPPTSN